MTFDQFYDELYALGTQGFAGQSRFTLNLTKRLDGKKAATSKRYQIRWTKKGAISTLTKQQLRERLQEDGLCTSTGSLKYEEAAVTTLFSGDVVHYLISAWTTGKLEDAKTASYSSRIPNTEVHNRAHGPKLTSQTLNDIQFKMMKEVSNAPRTEIFHSVVFCSAHKDCILSQGQRRGMVPILD